MDLDLDSPIAPDLLETSWHLGSFDPYDLYHPTLLHNNYDYATDSNDVFENTFNNGIGLTKQSLASDALALQLKEVFDPVQQLTEHKASPSTIYKRVAGKESTRIPYKRPGHDRAAQVKAKRRRKTKCPFTAVEAEEKRKSYLERNRIAASKCRRRKSEQVASLRQKEIALETANARMKLEHTQLKDEVDKLKVLVMMHAPCSHIELSSRKNFRPGLTVY
jgi:hypothetical protein